MHGPRTHRENSDAQFWQITRCTSSQLPLSIVWPVMRSKPMRLILCRPPSPQLPRRRRLGRVQLRLQQPARWHWRLIEQPNAEIEK
jgi:hypothetical protein